MKTTWITLLALVNAVALPRISNDVDRKVINTETQFCLYYVYDGFGNQCDDWNYSVTAVEPFSCFLSDRLCWFRVCDEDLDGDVDTVDFWFAFWMYDTNFDCSLDDELEIHGVLEKRGL